MVDQPLSAMTQFAPLGRMLIYVIDPAAGVGLKSGGILLSALLAQLQEASNGSQIWNGTGSPSEGLGSLGDYYIDNGTGYLYGPKNSTGWPESPISLTSPVITALTAALAAETEARLAAEAALGTQSIINAYLYGGS